MTSVQSRKQTVLVVDDDAVLRDIMARALTDEGFDVLTAGDGEQALAIASTLGGQLALVVTDIRMAGMDGLELASRLACLEFPPPVLFISGFTAERNIPGPLLTKPFGPTAFLEQIGRMLPSVQHH
jgi:CheY-like chemotaxis protein